MRFIALALLVLCLFSCSADNETFTTREFDQTLFECSADSLDQSLQEWQNTYRDFLPVFSEFVIDIGPVGAPNYSEYLKQFRTDPVIMETYQKRLEIYPDFDKYSRAIHKGIAKYQAMIKDEKPVAITSFISGFNQSFISLEHELAIGLDNYLGADFEFYAQLRLPKYLTETKSPDYLIADAVRAWILSDLPEEESEDLITRMITEGKVLYLTELCLPKHPKHLIFRYEKDELDWLNQQEKSMWEFLVGKELLFSSDRILIKRLCDDAPFSREFGNDSPGRAGNWIGYQIVKRYMAKSNCDVMELLHSKNAREILAASGYRP